mmetsp:Transcript_13951/g.27886  ORF Transcript_13951/g.27886 Transcript_13951/m.27886 type:complete len:96 (+) Transcript_13951:678-965(+)
MCFCKELQSGPLSSSLPRRSRGKVKEEAKGNAKRQGCLPLPRQKIVVVFSVNLTLVKGKKKLGECSKKEAADLSLEGNEWLFNSLTILRVRLKGR